MPPIAVTAAAAAALLALSAASAFASPGAPPQGYRPPVPACDTGRTCAPLWPQGAPGAKGTAAADIPFLTQYAPDSGAANGAAVVIFPGGAYGMLARRKEGVEPALWLAGMGIRAFVLDYRLGPVYRHPVPMGDAARAVRWVRAHAARFGLDGNRIGVLGFSAGGHLAATLATHFDAGDPRSPDPIERRSDRPDFQILVYPVISMQAPFTHRASRTNLLGRNPDPADLAFLSAERHVTASTPPAFIVHAETDPIVPFANSRAYADALGKAGVSVEFLAFAQGGHAFGLGDDSNGTRGPLRLSTWPARCGEWLAAQGILIRPPSADTGAGDGGPRPARDSGAE